MFQLIHEQHKTFVIANLIELNEIIHHDPRHQCHHKNAVKRQEYRQNSAVPCHCHKISKANGSGRRKTVPKTVRQCGDGRLCQPDCHCHQKQQQYITNSKPFRMGDTNHFPKQRYPAHVISFPLFFQKKYPVFFWEGNTGISKIAMGLYCT